MEDSIPWWRKGFVGQFIYARCSNCNAKVYLKWYKNLLIMIPFLAAIMIKHETVSNQFDYFYLLGGLILMFVLASFVKLDFKK